MELKDIIIRLKADLGFNNTQIAKELGVTKTTVGRWISGEIKNIQDETAENLSELLGFDVKAAISGEIINFKKPILGFAKAGYDLFLDSNYLGEEELTYQDYIRGDFFLRVTGDSMIGEGIMNNSLVYVKKTNIVNSKDIAVIMVGNEITIKKVIFKTDTLILEAANPTVENRYFSKEEVETLPVKIIGKVLYSKTEFN
jgi:repressor LexA